MSEPLEYMVPSPSSWGLLDKRTSGTIRLHRNASARRPRGADDGEGSNLRLRITFHGKTPAHDVDLLSARRPATLPSIASNFCRLQFPIPTSQCCPGMKKPTCASSLNRARCRSATSALEPSKRMWNESDLSSPIVRMLNDRKASTLRLWQKWQNAPPCQSFRRTAPTHQTSCNLGPVRPGPSLLNDCAAMHPQLGNSQVRQDFPKRCH